MAFAQLKPRVKEIVSHQPDPNPKVSVEELTEKEYEKRMNIIGQNGNDGLHYEDPTKSTLPPMSFDIPLYDPQTGELNPYYEDLTDKKLPTYFEEEELSRLTDTTQTLIVKEPKTEKETIKEIVEEFQEDDLIDEWLDELGKEKGLNSQEENLPLKKTLRYTKRK